MTDLIHRFYEAFARRDHAGMAACYHQDATFEDEAFSLRGKQIHAMWHMLTERGTDLHIVHSDVRASEREGQAHWEATYTFTATGRKVHNRIDARFEFKDGKIWKHRDSFDFWRWSRQALGTPGLLLGWSGWLRQKVRRTAAGQLDRFIQKNRQYQS